MSFSSPLLRCGMASISSQDSPLPHTAVVGAGPRPARASEARLTSSPPVSPQTRPFASDESHQEEKHQREKWQERILDATRRP